MKAVIVPVMLVLAGTLMSFAWIGHLKFKGWTFFMALIVSWMIVLPEYILNVFATRWGITHYTGAQMAAIHLASGVIAVNLISAFFLGEPVVARQIAGFALMILAVGLIVGK